jgi:hypothetical protein
MIAFGLLPVDGYQGGPGVLTHAREFRPAISTKKTGTLQGQFAGFVNLKLLPALIRSCIGGSHPLYLLQL